MWSPRRRQAVAAATRTDGDSLVTVVAIAFVAGYFGSAIAWAVLGAAGGDRQVLLLDLAADEGRVEQSLLWRWKRAAAFDLDDVDRVYVWSSRGLPLRLTRTHMVAIAFETQKPLSLGEYHTDGEAMAMASPVASFLDVPVRPQREARQAQGSAWMSEAPTNETAPDCLFCRMARGEIPIEPLLANDDVFALRDINPRAPVHVLLIPRRHVADARSLTAAEGPLLGALFAAAAEVGRLEGIDGDGYRLAFNVGEAAGMTIPHLHLHLVGGRQLGPEG